MGRPLLLLCIILLVAPAALVAQQPTAKPATPDSARLIRWVRCTKR